jgi:LPXTG-motif cell wall-anchored protein
MHHNPKRLVRFLTAAATGVVGFGLVFAAAGPAAAAPTVASVVVDAPATEVAGQTFTVSIDLTSVTDVYAYDLALSYDPAVVSYVAGSATAPAGGFDTVNATSGVVELIHTRLGSSPALQGDLTLTADFTASGVGTTAFVVSSISLIDPAQAATTQTNAATDATIVTAAATSSPTPSPSAGTGGGSGSGAGSTPAGSSSVTDPSLASTGQDAVPFVVIGGILLVLGALAVVLARRRRRVGGIQ